MPVVSSAIQEGAQDLSVLRAAAEDAVDGTHEEMRYFLEHGQYEISALACWRCARQPAKPARAGAGRDVDMETLAEEVVTDAVRGEGSGTISVYVAACAERMPPLFMGLAGPARRDGMPTWTATRSLCATSGMPTARVSVPRSSGSSPFRRPVTTQGCGRRASRRDGNGSVPCWAVSRADGRSPRN
ncbi:ALF repeat-containing protein [Streptomyces sp. NPDC057909]|uniref:ALF repeat-containing protein n=1 Tax=Streptomyces sp. NPDC057909 TaxID=3346277 RepID=UPI0036EFC5F9